MKSTRPDPFVFTPSPTCSLGVEVELQIVDPETRAPAPGAVPILQRCRDEAIGGVSAEFMQSMIEIKTGVCGDVTQVQEQLVPLAACVRNIARSLGYEIALAGTHPFGRPNANAVFPDERYERIRDRLGWVAAHDLIFGVHVHVGVSGGAAAVLSAGACRASGARSDRRGGRSSRDRASRASGCRRRRPGIRPATRIPCRRADGRSRGVSDRGRSARP